MLVFRRLAAAAALSALAGCSLPVADHAGTPRTADSHVRVRHLQSDLRHTKDVTGSPPVGAFEASVTLYDAPLSNLTNPVFNAAILGVDVLDAAGDAYQLVGYSPANVVNLLSLQQTPLALGSGTLPAGTYATLELLVDAGSTTASVGGSAVPVQFVAPHHPFWDTTQTIVAIDVPLTLTGVSGGSVQATLDFNLFESASFRSGVIQVVPTVAGGLGRPVVTGRVANAAGGPVSRATIVATRSDGSVANTSVSGSDGSFTLHALGAGSYTVSVQNSSTTNAGDTIAASGADPGAAPSTVFTVGPTGSLDLGTLVD